jgi:Uma2 family endonuclease
MIQTLTAQKLTVQEFLEQKPDGRYELHNGIIVERAQPTGKHENVTGFLTIQLSSSTTSIYSFSYRSRKY